MVTGRNPSALRWDLLVALVGYLAATLAFAGSGGAGDALALGPTKAKP